jgi:hypothetical protein
VHWAEEALTDAVIELYRSWIGFDRLWYVGVASRTGVSLKIQLRPPNDT